MCVMGQATAVQQYRSWSANNRRSVGGGGEDEGGEEPLRSEWEPLMSARRRVQHHPLDDLCNNLVEMIPLASLDQSVSTFEHSKGKLVRGQLRVDRESPLWDNAENMLHDDHRLYSEEMIHFNSNQRPSRAVTPSSETTQLRKVQQLEQKLFEKERQLEHAEGIIQELNMQLNSTTERLQSQNFQKDQALQNIQNQLFERQLEVVNLQSLVKKSEVNVQASSMKAASLEEELNGLRSQLAALLFLVQSQISGPMENSVQEIPSAAEELPAFEKSDIEEPISSNICEEQRMADMLQMDSPSVTDKLEKEHIEAMRKKYESALFSARENPNDEMLSLVAELRMQLLECVMCPEITGTTNEESVSQTLRTSICG
ncbi:hypothetical protein KP509_01G007700 [Ceratopteris richardii]|uniref:Uncharacterized protein n=1 Tax=Ceratopteris richardii TaxID=49495 RepID=A0A8T2VDI7_CERRI|nr:hypothetical protein KP509_01G007700 [Ceratopteris richardii]